MGTETIVQLILATLFGAAIGIERKLKRKEAGPQTYSLVSLGACLFGIIAFFLFEKNVIRDSSSLFIAISVGMGFIGAGTIFHKEGKIEGITTAAGLWVTAIIGLAVGIKFYFLALATTILVLFIFLGLGFFEKKFLKDFIKE